MAWITTDDGRKVNTEWFDEDERKKYEQIEKAQKEADKLNNPNKEHFAKENRRVEDFMKKRSGSLEMKNGQILEHYSLGEMKNMILKDAKDAGELYEDDAISIQYVDGSVESYVGGDDTSKMKLSNINGVIWNNANTIAYAGKGIKIENYKEKYPEDYPDEKGYEDDWRMDFEYYKKG